MPFEKYLRGILKHYRLILVCGFVAGIVAFIVMNLVPPTYEAVATLAIVKSGEDVNFDPKFRTVSEFDLAQSVVDQVARRKALATIASSPELVTGVLDQVEGPTNTAARPLSDWMRDLAPRSDGDLIQLDVRSESPEKAARLANAWASALEARVNAIYGDNAISLAEIQTQAAAAKRDYDAKQGAVVAYLGQNPSGQLTRTLSEKQQALKDSLALGIQLDRLVADAQALRDRLAKGASVGSGEQLASLMLEANSFNASSNLAAPFSDTNSPPINLQIQIAPSSGAAAGEQLSSADALLTALQARRQQLQTVNVQQLQQEVNTLQAQIEQENSKYKVLSDARDRAWTTFTTVSNKAAELDVAAQAQGTLVKSAITAITPTEPVETRIRLYTVLAGGAGLLLGIAFAAGLEWLELGSLWRDARKRNLKPEPALAQERQLDSDE
jgi:capsular polysaccharide biosynthesis protein